MRMLEIRDIRVGWNALQSSPGTEFETDASLGLSSIHGVRARERCRNEERSVVR